MQPFLKQLAIHLFRNYSGQLHRVCIIFPNRRAGLFLRQYLSELISQPTWLPQIFALEDFVRYHSKLTIPDQLTLTIRLYHAYRSVEGIQAKKFSEFLAWGNMLLADFDEIDQYLVDGNAVFQYMDELKAIQHWNPDGSPLTDFEKQYLGFYHSLAAVYSAFKKLLLEKDEAYFGMAFEQVIKQLTEENEPGWDKIIFAGFNALTTAEESLIKYFVSKGQAEVIWDADEYYLGDYRQEAGHFLRNILKDPLLKSDKWIGEEFKNGHKKITSIGVPGNIGQAKLAGHLIEELLKTTDPSDIALILVDESLLLPVLNSMPPQIDKYNITMGYPIKLTPAYSFFDSVFRLFKSSVRPATDHPSGKQQNRFLHKDVERLLTHPYIVFFKTENRENEELIKSLLKKSILRKDELLQLLNLYAPELGIILKSLILDLSIQPLQLLSGFQKTISSLKNKITELDANANSWENIDTEFLYQYALIVESLRIAVAETDLIDNLDTLYEVFKSQASSLRLPFYGEPLHGLQLMGVLETRTLDFKHIVMLSVNEGLLPKGKHQHTFIPFEVRKQFNLQLYKERNAVFAYHFYRLLQRAENIQLLYNTEGNELGGGEKSRFITQLLNEIPKYNNAIVIDEKIFAVPALQSEDCKIVIEKSPAIKQRLIKLSEHGLSPTALSRYLICSLQFCYSYIFNIREKETVEETLDAATLGEVIHKALHLTYLPFHQSHVSKKDLIASIPVALQHLKTVFSEEYKENDMETGKNLLIYKVAEGMLKRFIKTEAEYLDKVSDRLKSFHIILLEEPLNREIEIADRSSGAMMKVTIKGKADRIDKVGNIIRIIDYKTGIVKKNEIAIQSMDDIFAIENPSKILQLLLYAWMFQKKADNKLTAEDQIVSGIISLRQPSQYLINAEIGKQEHLDSNLLIQFQQILQNILEELLDESIPFRQTTNLDHCKNCPFKTLCNRM